MEGMSLMKPQPKKYTFHLIEYTLIKVFTLPWGVL